MALLLSGPPPCISPPVNLRHYQRFSGAPPRSLSVISLSQSPRQCQCRLRVDSAQQDSFRSLSLSLSRSLPFSNNRKPFSSFSFSSFRPNALAFFLLGGGGNTGGSGSGSGGGGGGGGGRDRDGRSGFWSWLFSVPAAIAKEEEKTKQESSSSEWDSHGLPANLDLQLALLSGFKRYKISHIEYVDLAEDENDDGCSLADLQVPLIPGGIYTKTQLQTELQTLTTCGMFESVSLKTKTNPDGTLTLTVAVKEYTTPPADDFKCITITAGLRSLLSDPVIEVDLEEKAWQDLRTPREMEEYLTGQETMYREMIDNANPCLLPPQVHDEVVGILTDHHSVSSRLLSKIGRTVGKWYHSQGYLLASVTNVGVVNDQGNQLVVAEVLEGQLNRIRIRFLDKLGYVIDGNTNLSLVKRQLPDQFQSGHIFNNNAARQALNNINSLKLFSSIDIIPGPDESKSGGFIVDINLREFDRKHGEVTIEWSIVPAGNRGLPTLASILPGGTVSFEHRNIQGLNRSIVGSVATANFFNPKDDLAINFEYVHPYLDGIHDARNRTLRTSCFNTRKLSPVFTGGPGIDEVPPVWVDRSGVKLNISEDLTRQSRFTYGLVIEEIKTSDDNGFICTRGQRVLPTGEIDMDGPQTTLTGTGVDRMLFAQANITRDNTKFVNGAIVGDRNVLQFDQGLGIGTKLPLFNRHQLTLTKFIPLKQVEEEGEGKPPPPILVLHGHYGGCVGDLPSYDAFTLGGPYSVRGYSMGELGAARNIIEVAAELRVPVRNTHVYAFIEHGNDLGSSKDVKGNPTLVYRRLGSGSSYGVGLNLGTARAEYAVDHNSGTGAVFFRFGERF